MSRSFKLRKTFLLVAQMYVGPILILVVFSLIAFGSFVSGEWRDPEYLLFSIVFFAVMSGVLWSQLRVPTLIELEESGRITFRGPLRRIQMQASEIRSIQPGGHQLGMLEVQHSGGKIRLYHQFDDFHVFLTRLEEMNPFVELRGC